MAMIYLDHAAATPLSQKAREAMEPYFSERFFNPSAAYLPAKAVAAEYLAAKDGIAHAIGAKGVDLTMTGSATEANNLAFTCLSEDGEALVLATEHDSVLKAAERRFQQMARDGGVSDGAWGGGKNGDARGGDRNGDPGDGATKPWMIKVDRNGMIDLADLWRKITPRTELVSVALVNNELGTIQPLAEVARILREVRAERLASGSQRPIFLHSDASQALGLLDVSVARLGADLMTLNAAKVYGPKGVGALYAARGMRLRPLAVGGGQENGLRSGTENVAGVVGFMVALTEAKKHLVANRRKYAELRRILLTELEGYRLVNGGAKRSDDAGMEAGLRIGGGSGMGSDAGTGDNTEMEVTSKTKVAMGARPKGRWLDNFVVLCYNGLDGERLLYLLEEQGVYVATGAACAASKGERSHVLAAIGLSESEIAGSLRLTLGETNDAEQMHEAARLINEAVAAERRRLAGRQIFSKKSNTAEHDG